jgi:molybdopterin synthase catalytic subunit
MRIETTDEVIPATEIAAEIKAGPDGAVCVFDGIVRDNSRGRKTLHLDYEAYREMALEQMRALAGEAVVKFGVRDVAVVHRLGRLFVGETSVLVVVASAHRGAAFDACRWLIDTLKKTVPIWKKEQFVDGAVWADGEAFPSEIRLQGSSEVEVRSADGSGEEGGRASPPPRAKALVGDPGSHDAHTAESMYGAPGSVGGGASEDASISESRYGGPGSGRSDGSEAGE